MINTMYLRRSGLIENSIEKLIGRVLLASQNTTEDWVHLNLGTLDPSNINSEDWQSREDKEIFPNLKPARNSSGLEEVQG